jgi:hypothetical protein
MHMVVVSFEKVFLERLLKVLVSFIILVCLKGTKKEGSGPVNMIVK